MTETTITGLNHERYDGLHERAMVDAASRAYEFAALAEELIKVPSVPVGQPRTAMENPATLIHLATMWADVATALQGRNK